MLIQLVCAQSEFIDFGFANTIVTHEMQMGRRWVHLAACYLIIPAAFYLTGEAFGPTYPSNVSAQDPRIPLTLSLEASLSGAFNTTGAVLGVQLALDLIGKRNVIPGYRLQYSMFDSKVGHHALCACTYRKI